MRQPRCHVLEGIIGRPGLASASRESKPLPASRGVAARDDDAQPQRALPTLTWFALEQLLTRHGDVDDRYRVKAPMTAVWPE